MGKKFSGKEYEVYMNVFDSQSLAQEDVTYINSKFPNSKIHSEKEIYSAETKQTELQITQQDHIEGLLSEDFITVTGRGNRMPNIQHYLSFGNDNNLNVALLTMNGKFLPITH